MRPIQSSLSLVLTALIWGLSFVAQSVGMEYVGPFTFNCVRNLLGGIVLIPVIFLFDRRSSPRIAEGRKFSLLEGTPAQKRTLLIGGVACGTALAVASSLQQFGILDTTVGKAGFITALYIVIVPIFGLFFRRRVAPSVWLAVVIALVGLYLLSITDDFSIGRGDVLVILCAFGFSAHILLIDHFSPRTDSVRLSCIQFLVCGIQCGVCMFLFENPSVRSLLSAWLPILYSGVLSCAVAYTLQVIAQKYVEPTVASLILSLESVFAALFGWLILRQSMSMKELAGCLLVFCAIILAQIPQKRWIRSVA
ncbi:MAG: DMT family transporter [Sphaerochaetaceae bacterium]|jgi:drug/metabolite transporter (DMT)-like permease